MIIMIIRRLRTREELEEFGRVEERIWGGQSPPPPELLKAISDNGGLVLGAFDGDRMVGILLGFAGFHHGRIYHYSHQAGVLPEYRDKGIGYMLKMEQRKEVLSMGIDLIIWTFNPLMSRNALFNVGKLGAVVRCYMMDYYGSMNDYLNRGIPTDRVIAEWWVKSDRVNGWRPVKANPLLGGNIVETNAVKKGNAVFRVPTRVVRIEGDPLFLEIPTDILALRDSLGYDAVNSWVNAYREAFEYLLSGGYHATDVVRMDGRSFYVFTKASEGMGEPICHAPH